MWSLRVFVVAMIKIVAKVRNLKTSGKNQNNNLIEFVSGNFSIEFKPVQKITKVLQNWNIFHDIIIWKLLTNKIQSTEIAYFENCVIKLTNF